MLFCKGNQTQCCKCHKPKVVDLGTPKRERVTEEQSREAKLGEANGRPDPIRESELEQLIKKLRKEKEEIACRLLSDKERIEKELHEHKKTEMKIKRKNESLTIANEDSLQKIKEPRKQEQRAGNEKQQSPLENTVRGMRNKRKP